MRTRACLALTLLLPAALAAQANPADRWEGVRERIRQQMEERDIPSVVVAVARDGEIVWEEGFGWADKERRIPATPETMYSLASISKPLTATALMQLVEQGTVELDRPANDYLGEGRIHSTAWDPTEATVRRVLSHTAGLPMHWEFFYEGESHPPRTTDEGIARYGALVNPPGAVFEYSNLGYGVLDRIIERATGRGYAEYMRDEVFLPLGMTRSAVGTGAGLAGAAIRYDTLGSPVPFYDFDHRGGSAVYSSVRDLVRFGAYHLGDPVGGEPRILREETIDLMQRRATPGTAPDEQGYGLGWLVLEDDHGYRRVSHTGGMPGVSTALYLYPEEDLAVAVLTNRGGMPAGRLAQEAAAVVLPRYADSLRAAAERGRTDAPTSTPQPELLGRWSGAVHTHEGEVPLSVEVRPDGEVRVQLASQPATSLKDPVFADGALTGGFAGTMPTADARQHPHDVRLELWLRDGRLRGQATAVSKSGGAHFALSSFAELRREHAR